MNKLGRRIGVPVAALVAYWALARPRMLFWGATPDEVTLNLAGDEIIPQPDLTATRAVTIQASAAAVWPWIVQLGQGRGGFYSYDFLENLVGSDIHSAEKIVPEWQSVEAGSEFKLAQEVVLSVAFVEPGRALVVRGGIPMGSVAAPYDFSWAFVLRDEPDGATRLVVRERYGYLRWWAPAVVEPAELISFAMSQRMLRGIKERAERAVASTDSPRRPLGDLTARSAEDFESGYGGAVPFSTAPWRR